MLRSREEIISRCKAILNQPDIVRTVENSSSPTAAYDIVKADTGDDAIAKAARWLGILRRDYPAAYAELTQPTLRHATNGTAQKGQGDEKVLREGPKPPT